jgi:putative tryptophan/tyrosine transport system substrate-binding protein
VEGGAMKKSIVSTILLTLAVCLSPAKTLFAGGKNLKIAMIQWRGETEACRGFKDALKELGYSAQYTVLNADQSRTRLGTLLREELLPHLDTFDYVYSYGTTASKMTKTILNNKAPHVFSNVAAPVESEIVSSMASSGENISGTSNRIPLSVQIETAAKIISFRTLGILFNSREKNAMVIRDELYNLGKKHNFEVIDLRSPPAEDLLEKNLQALNNKQIVVDAVYLPLDSYLLTKADVIGPRLRSAKIKSIAAQKKYIEKGALFGVIPDYYKLGKVVAKIIDRHQKGEQFENIPVGTPEDPLIMVNKTTAKTLGVTIPENVMKNAIVVE